MSWCSVGLSGVFNNRKCSVCADYYYTDEHEVLLTLQLHESE